jgi:hypothetical protein
MTVRLNVEIDLDDVAQAIEYATSYDRHDIADFVIGVDQSMADADWSTRLVERLAVSLAQEFDSDGWESASIVVETDLAVPGLPDGTVTVPMAIPVERIVRALAAQAPSAAVTILGKAVALRQDEENKDKQQRDAQVCGNCGHPRAHHFNGEEDCGDLKNCMCERFRENCVLLACQHPMSAHNKPYPCANDTRTTNCHPCAVAEKEQ